jgi:hypothetical protein
MIDISCQDLHEVSAVQGITFGAPNGHAPRIQVLLLVLSDCRRYYDVKEREQIYGAAKVRRLLALRFSVTSL